MNLCMLTHLHMSLAVAAQAAMRGDRSYAASPRVTRGAGSQRDTGKGREMPRIQSSVSNDTTFLSVFVTFLRWGGGEVTPGLLRLTVCPEL